jgi:hypothetical protein
MDIGTEKYQQFLYITSPFMYWSISRNMGPMLSSPNVLPGQVSSLPKYGGRKVIITFLVSSGSRVPQLSLSAPYSTAAPARPNEDLIEEWRLLGCYAVCLLLRAEVSEELSDSFARVTRIGELGTTLAVSSNQRTQRESIAS